MVTVPWPSTTTHCSERSRCRCKLSLFPGATVILLTLYLGWSSRISNEPHGRSSLYLLETIFMLPQTKLRRAEGRCDLAARCERVGVVGQWEEGIAVSRGAGHLRLLWVWGECLAVVMPQRLMWLP